MHPPRYRLPTKGTSDTNAQWFVSERCLSSAISIGERVYFVEVEAEVTAAAVADVAEAAPAPSAWVTVSMALETAVDTAFVAP